jgi:hypothetical protein
MVASRGDQGDGVLEIQRLLQSWGFEIADDGDFGSETETAVEDFQSRMGLEVDGLVGPDTLTALRATAGADQGTPEPAVDTGPSTDPGRVETGTPPALVAVENPGGDRITDKTEPPPGDVVTVDGFGGKAVKLHHLAATFWFQLVDAARSDGLAAPLLLPVSGLRTMARQQELWDRALRKYGSEQEARKWVAEPGGSAHHSGRAIECWLAGVSGLTEPAA